MSNAAAVRAFNLALDQFIGQQVPAIALAVQQKYALKADELVVIPSPVDTGRFRGAWQLSTTPTVTPTGHVEKVPRGTPLSGAMRAAAEAAIATAQPYGVIYLTNPLPYAERLENGWSQQAPAGVVALAVTALQGQILEELGR